MVPRIIARYTFREVCWSSLFCFAIFLLTGLIAGFLPILGEAMKHGAGLTFILFKMLANALPSTLVTVLPFSMTIGILLGLGRLTADNEIMAAKASGIPTARLLPPVVLLGLLGMALSLMCTLWLIPRGITKGRELLETAVTTRPDAGLEERVFFDKSDNLIIYVERIDPTSRVLTNVFIKETPSVPSSDGSPAQAESFRPNRAATVMAKKGKIVPDPDGKALILHLKEGTILTENRNGDCVGTLDFQSQVFRYPLKTGGRDPANKSFEERSIADIRQQVREHRERELTAEGTVKEYLRRVQRMGRLLVIQRFTYPLACLALAMAAFPLGVLDLGKSRLNNVSIGLAVIFLYYALSLSVERAARSGLAPPEAVMPIPAVLFITASLFMIRSVNAERTPWVIRAFANLGGYLKRCLRAIGRRG